MWISGADRVHNTVVRPRIVIIVVVGPCPHQVGLGRYVTPLPRSINQGGEDQGKNLPLMRDPAVRKRETVTQWQGSDMP